MTHYGDKKLILKDKSTGEIIEKIRIIKLYEIELTKLKKIRINLIKS